MIFVRDWFKKAYYSDSSVSHAPTNSFKQCCDLSTNPALGKNQSKTSSPGYSKTICQ